MAEILDDNAAAVAELIAVADETLLGNPALTVDGVDVPGVVQEITQDEVIVAGGVGEAGGFTATVAKASFPDGTPEKFTTITARGMSLHILSVTKGTAHYVLTAGDPVDRQA